MLARLSISAAFVSDHPYIIYVKSRVCPVMAGGCYRGTYTNITQYWGFQIKIMLAGKSVLMSVFTQ